MTATRSSLGAEHLLGRAFERRLRSNPDQLQLPNRIEIVREMESLQGRPDLVVTPSVLSAAINRDRIAIGKTIGRPSSAKILSLLSLVVPRTTRYLEGKTRLTQRTLSTRLRELDAVGLVRLSTSTKVLATRRFAMACIPLWAFEYKLSLTQRALFQALQYRAFAEKTFIIVPENEIDRPRNLGIIRQHSVGCISIDKKGRFTILSVANSRSPLSRYQYLYALGQFLCKRSSAHAGSFGRH